MTDIAAPKIITTTDFRNRFTVFEEAGILAASSTNPIISVFYSRLLDNRLENIWHDNPVLLQGLQYLSTIDNPLSTETPKAKILTAERIVELLS